MYKPNGRLIGHNKAIIIIIIIIIIIVNKKLYTHNTKGDVALTNISRETNYFSLWLCRVSKTQDIRSYSALGMFLACS